MIVSDGVWKGGGGGGNYSTFKKGEIVGGGLKGICINIKGK